jgi:hypothetical protein
VIQHDVEDGFSAGQSARMPANSPASSERLIEDPHGTLPVPLF